MARRPASPMRAAMGTMWSSSSTARSRSRRRPTVRPTRMKSASTQRLATSRFSRVEPSSTPGRRNRLPASRSTARTTRTTCSPSTTPTAIPCHRAEPRSTAALVEMTSCASSEMATPSSTRLPARSPATAVWCSTKGPATNAVLSSPGSNLSTSPGSPPRRSTCPVPTMC